MKEAEEKRRNRKSAVITGGVQVLLVLVLYFLIAWKQPFPPIPEYGIEISFGKQDSGRPASSAPVSAVEAITEVKTQATAASETQPEDSEEPTDAPLEVEAEEVISPVAASSSEDEPVEEEEIQEASSEAIQDSQEQPSVEEPIESLEEAQQELPAEIENIEDQSQGEDDTPGIAGDPEVAIDQRALYGNVTGQDGASLQLTGWVWDFKPTPLDNSTESGRIVYKVTIDDDGYIIKITTEMSTVSPTVEKYYRQAVERLTFSKTSAYKPAPTSVGTITFIIKTR